MKSPAVGGDLLVLSPGSAVVGLGFLETNDRLACFGVAQSFTGEAFDGFGIEAQGVDGGPQLLAGFLLLLDQRIKTKDLLSVTFVLLDERQIPDGDQENARNENKKDHHPGQFVPDAKIDFHRTELNMGGAATEVNKFAAPATERNRPAGVNMPKCFRLLFSCQAWALPVTLLSDD